jgi:hypothetical protein
MVMPGCSIVVAQTPHPQADTEPFLSSAGGRFAARTVLSTWTESAPNPGCCHAPVSRSGHVELLLSLDTNAVEPGLTLVPCEPHVLLTKSYVAERAALNSRTRVVDLVRASCSATTALLAQERRDLVRAFSYDS